MVPVRIDEPRVMGRLAGSAALWDVFGSLINARMLVVGWHDRQHF